MTTLKSMPTIEPDKAEESPAKFIDHTLLSPLTTQQQIELLCEEAVEWGVAAVCIPPAFVPCAVSRLYGSEVGVASVVGFPCGYDTTASKVQQAAELVNVGCSEIDMVIQLGSALTGQFGQIEEEITQVVLAATAAAARVKVIIECCYLDLAQKIALTQTVVRSGAAFVKTSTGFGPFGATIEDVQLLSKTAAGRIEVKAAGGIRTLEDFRAMQRAGASRIGTSCGGAIMRQWTAGQ